MPGANIEFSELKEPIFAYDIPGSYSITQTVEYAGCFSDFTVDVTVVVPEEVTLKTDQALCQDKPLAIDISQSFEADYLWLSDSSTVATREINMAGIYPIEIADRHCVQQFDINVQEFDFDLIEVPLAADISICMQRPVEINPDIDPASTFTWSDEFPTLQRNISETGFYSLTTSLSGCSTTSSIAITA